MNFTLYPSDLLLDLEGKLLDKWRMQSSKKNKGGWIGDKI